MNILLIDPRVFSISPEAPLGLAYLAAVAEQAGHEVSIVDRPTLGMDIKELRREISDTNPDVIGVTALTHTYDDAREVMLISKETCPDTTIVIGGAHPTMRDIEVLKDIPIDDLVVVRGEGEATFLDLLNSFEKGRDLKKIFGISYKTSNQVIRNPARALIHDLDRIPNPARHLLPMNIYLRKTGYTHVLTSRGCPYSCIFCSVSAIWGHTYRRLSPTLVVDELEHLVHKYNFRKIAFYDDAFTTNSNHVSTICDEIIERKLDIEWWCAARTDSVTKALLRKMRNAGCTQIFYGIETANQGTLNLIKKRTTVNDAKKAVSWAKECEISVSCSFIIGLPGEDKNMVLRTIKFIKQLDPDVVDINFLKPYPGTEIAENPEDYGVRLLYKNPWKKIAQYQPLIGYPVTETERLRTKDMFELYLVSATELPLLKQFKAFELHAES